MANHAYISVWCNGFSEETMLGLYERLLATAPFSEKKPGFTELVIRPVSSAETPLIECDFRLHPLVATELVAAARDHINRDSAYEAAAHWDLWAWAAVAGSAPASAELGWQLTPQPLEIACYGQDYDEGIAAESGHFRVDLGFEHFFTGHAHLLGAELQAVPAAADPAEEPFLGAMADPANRNLYHQKTAANIQKLMDWLRRIREALPVSRDVVWSEGEENFEARLDEILAVR